MTSEITSAGEAARAYLAWVGEERAELMEERDKLRTEVKTLKKDLDVACDRGYDAGFLQGEKAGVREAREVNDSEQVIELKTALQRSNEESSKLRALNDVFVRRLNGIQHELTAAGEEAERLQNGS